MGEIDPGTLIHTVLIYSVSEPGEWTAEDIADDLPEGDPAQVRRAVAALVAGGLLHQNSTDHRLYPSRTGKQVIRAAG